MAVPEKSFGLTPMYGADGWCGSCSVPRHPQCGSLVLQRKSFKVHGAWTPYWQYDAICLEAGLADEIAGRFGVDLVDVEWHASSPGHARQIIAPAVGAAWFDPGQLRTRTVAQHGTPGAACAACGVWRWLSLEFEPGSAPLGARGADQPPGDLEGTQATALAGGAAVAADDEVEAAIVELALANPTDGYGLGAPAARPAGQPQAHAARDARAPVDPAPPPARPPAGGRDSSASSAPISSGVST